MEIAKIILEYIRTLIWPLIVSTLLIVYRKECTAVLRSIRKLTLPGGTSFETFPKDLEEAKVLSFRVKEEADRKPIKKKKECPVIPLTDANTQMLNRGLTPIPSGLEVSYYNNLAEQDPNLALASLRFEIEILLKNVAKGFKVEIGKRDSAGIVARKLQKKNAITTHQCELINVIISLCNSAMHGQRVTQSQVKELLDVFAVLRDYYISWLSWGFNNE